MAKKRTKAGPLQRGVQRRNVGMMNRVKGTPARSKESSPKLMLSTIVATAIAMGGIIFALARRAKKGDRTNA